LQQRADLLPDTLGQPPGRWPPAASVDEAADSVGAEPALETLELANGEVQRGGSLSVGDAPGEGGLDQARPGALPSCSS
jgi:hypothetical protein